MEAVLRAVADESRRTLLEALAAGPAGAGDLSGLLHRPARRVAAACGCCARRAITDPGRLSRRLGVFEGDLRLAVEFRARCYASGWEGTGHIDGRERLAADVG